MNGEPLDGSWATGDVFAIEQFHLNGYDFVDRIDEGGMCYVFKAWNAVRQRYSAIKVIRPKFSLDEVYAKRLHREIEVLRELDHPGIVKAYETSCTSQGGEHAWHFLEMEWLDGESLDSVVQDLRQRGETLSISDIRSLIIPICEGLHHAHTHPNGPFVHRDIKPSNIIVRKGQFDDPVLMDFGIVHVQSNVKLTENLSWVGSAEYMSPEHASNHVNLDGRSDLYSLGIVLYELATGNVPFPNTDGNALGVLASHIQQKVTPPREIRPEVPRWLEYLILRLLEKRPEHRFSSAKEVAELARFQEVASNSPLLQGALATQSLDADVREAMDEQRKLLGDKVLVANRSSGSFGMLVGLLLVVFLVFGVVTAVVLSQDAGGEQGNYLPGSDEYRLYQQEYDMCLQNAGIQKAEFKKYNSTGYREIEQVEEEVEHAVAMSDWETAAEGLDTARRMLLPAMREAARQKKNATEEKHANEAQKNFDRQLTNRLGAEYLTLGQLETYGDPTFCVQMVNAKDAMRKSNWSKAIGRYREMQDRLDVVVGKAADAKREIEKKQKLAKQLDTLCVDFEKGQREGKLRVIDFYKYSRTEYARYLEEMNRAKSARKNSEWDRARQHLQRARVGMNELLARTLAKKLEEKQNQKIAEDAKQAFQKSVAKGLKESGLTSKTIAEQAPEQYRRFHVKVKEAETAMSSMDWLNARRLFGQAGVDFEVARRAAIGKIREEEDLSKEIKAAQDNFQEIFGSALKEKGLNEKEFREYGGKKAQGIRDHLDKAKYAIEVNNELRAIENYEAATKAVGQAVTFAFNRKKESKVRTLAESAKLRFDDHLSKRLKLYGLSEADFSHYGKASYRALQAEADVAMRRLEWIAATKKFTDLERGLNDAVSKAKKDKDKDAKDTGVTDVDAKDPPNDDDFDKAKGEWREACNDYHDKRKELCKRYKVAEKDWKTRHLKKPSYGKLWARYLKAARRLKEDAERTKAISPEKAAEKYREAAEKYDEAAGSELLRKAVRECKGTTPPPGV